MTNMNIYEATIKNQWNIQPGSPLHKIETESRKQLDRMEERGVLLNLEKLIDLINETDMEVEILQKKIARESNGAIQAANSSAQVALFLQSEGFTLPKTRKGNPQVNQDTLVEINHPLIESILAYRKSLAALSQMRSVLKTVEHSRVFPHYDGLTCATGRMYTSNPNLQGWGEKAQSVITADPGFQLLAGDYKSQEIRILAAITNCEPLLNLIKSGEDIHKHTYAMMYHMNPEDVTPDQRAVAKALNFGTVYGQTTEGLARKQHQSLEWAQDAQRAWFSAYPEVERWLATQKAKSRRTGTTKTDAGRYRKLNYSYDPDKADRQAVNHPIQGAGADVMKRALARALSSETEDFQVLATIHDSLLVQYRNMTREEAEEKLRDIMVCTYLKRITLEVDVH